MCIKKQKPFRQRLAHIAYSNSRSKQICGWDDWLLTIEGIGPMREVSRHPDKIAAKPKDNPWLKTAFA